MQLKLLQKCKRARILKITLENKTKKSYRTNTSFFNFFIIIFLIYNIYWFYIKVYSWEIDGETVSDFIFGGSKITADGNCSHEIKRHFTPWKESYDQPR